MARDDATLIEALTHIAGREGVRVGEQVKLLDHGYHTENLAARIMVSPADTQQLAAVVQCCAAQGRSLVPQGGLTGLVGASASRPEDVIVSLRRMNRIVALDRESMTITVQAGVTLAQINEAAREAGLEFGVDLASRDGATVGGLISHNAGGLRAFRHGMTRQQVLGLEAVLADGTVFRDLNALTKNNTGYDLKQLFIGAEGTLGIVSCAVLRLVPQQRAAATALLGLADLRAGLEIVRRLRHAHYDRLLAVEVLWADYAACVRDAHPELANLVFEDCPLSLVVEVAHDDAIDMAQQLETLLESALEDGLLEDCIVASSGTQRERIWLLREDSDAVAHQGAHQLSFDVALPVPALDGYVRDLQAAFRSFDASIKLFVFGHLMDGNLHIMLAADTPLHDRYADIEALIYEPLAAVGGALSAEHGIGVEKKAALARYGDPQRLALMGAVRSLLDAKRTLNPGKVVD
ncbi:FAD-binding oxidoreductase [Paraburkholderia pallida]|uniref:FAD-binding oxidoreductase n=2 Tax=Paraburkholderia pallida TaxID=2547399 RepID=A0A4P7CWR5_9BURK|nr:FAD-binding oxidoreductase [Paraburkholderia pallida]